MRKKRKSKLNSGGRGDGKDDSSAAGLFNGFDAGLLDDFAGPWDSD
jgi:hypothetical protein